MQQICLNKGQNEEPLFRKERDVFQISQELLHIGPIYKHNQMVQYLINKRLVVDREWHCTKFGP